MMFDMGSSSMKFMDLTSGPGNPSGPGEPGRQGTGIDPERKGAVL